MKVLITGDREGFSEYRMRTRLEELPEGSIVVHGACRGVDLQVNHWAKDLGFEVRAYPADWRRYGPAAGPIRNKQMLDEEHPDLVLAFHSNFDESKGTKNMLKQAKERGIVTELIT